MMDEEPDSTEVVIKLFGEGKGFTNQPRDTLSKGVIETLDVIGLTTFFANVVECFGIEDSVVSFPEVHVGVGVQIALGQALP